MSQSSYGVKRTVSNSVCTAFIFISHWDTILGHDKKISISFPTCPQPGFLTHRGWRESIGCLGLLFSTLFICFFLAFQTFILIFLFQYILRLCAPGLSIWEQCLILKLLQSLLCVELTLSLTYSLLLMKDPLILPPNVPMMSPHKYFVTNIQ